MKLVLVRHGETPWNREGRFQGQGKVGLSQKGIRQAQAVAATLEGLAPWDLYSSPLPRSLQTASIVGGQDPSLMVVPVDELKEMDLGEVEGMTGPQMQARYSNIYHAWGKDPSQVQMPGGESLQQLQVRAWRAVEGMRERHPDGVVVAVSHSFTIVTIVCRLLEVPLSRFHCLRADLGSLTTIEWRHRGWRLASFNEVGHLRSICNQGS